MTYYKTQPSAYITHRFLTTRHVCTVASERFWNHFEPNSGFRQPRFRFTVREKRGDAKSALKNLLLNGGTCQVFVLAIFFLSPLPTREFSLPADM